MERIHNHPILEEKTGKKVKFYFDDQEYYGIEGEPVSTALIANDIEIFSIHRKADSPKGIFCANGQCSNCTVIIDGIPKKSCITPLEKGMHVQTLKHLPELPPDDHRLDFSEKKEFSCDVLVVGGGPSGLNATIELAKQGFSVTLVDDKEALGGKLVLQTHKFFGSIKDCYAGTRGIDIGKKLAQQVREFDNVRVCTNSSVVGIFEDKKAGIFKNNKSYYLINFKGLVVSTGAREKSLVFKGNDLPGVYGAGAFQTLVNRDMVQSSQRIFIVGSGNVGLIAAYHALQAGIEVAGICDILDDVSGYKVHADKIRRMGVPIYLNHTIISANGKEKVEKVTIAKVNDNYQPLLDTAKTFSVDTLLIAVGLSPVDEFYDKASQFDFPVVKAGDASEIAEASSAMFGGRIAGLEMSRKLGKDIEVDESYNQKAEILKSEPGDVYPRQKIHLKNSFQPIIHCVEEIPCNPCTSVCPNNAIDLVENKGDLTDVPEFHGECSGCTLCVAVCPGLAITLAKKINKKYAEVVLPHEFVPDFEEGDKIAMTDRDGHYLEKGEVLQIRQNRKYQTWIINARVSLENATEIAGIRIQEQEATQPLDKAEFEYIPDDGIVCQCEMVSAGEIVDYIKSHRVRDVNQLKQIRVGMGACGGNTCSTLLPRIFQKAGVDWEEVQQGTKRPLDREVPMFAIINEKAVEDDE
ncbi:MAG: FAD-dependent oxidoreductase [Candidatus Marinimicrobia bacterium]|nr:FAD-dependent oxidoreductase [Candidatus Neomarinimicrobiota bacterium]